ncbi:MAG: preprotein translocase subunit SecG, partial [Deltaproteobacteria bacterium]|nr:preprotein translocase subunit SecG [Deltaproteobacteria bacterium]
MISAVTTIHVLVAFVLMISVLLQTGKGAGLGAAFGGTSSSVFGARGPASLIGKVTTVAAIIFMTTSFVLAMYARGGPGRTLELPEELPTAAQAAPGP